MYKPSIQHRNAIADRIKADAINGNYNGNKRYERRWFGTNGNAQKPTLYNTAKIQETTNTSMEKQGLLMGKRFMQSLDAAMPEMSEKQSKQIWEGMRPETDEERIRKIKEELKEAYYQKICQDSGFKEFYKVYVNAVKLAQTEETKELKSITFMEQMKKLEDGKSDLACIMQERSYVCLFMTANGGYAVNNDGGPATLGEVVDASDIRVVGAVENEMKYMLVPSYLF